MRAELVQKDGTRRWIDIVDPHPVLAVPWIGTGERLFKCTGFFTTGGGSTFYRYEEA